jgi:hypothetical protein
MLAPAVMFWQVVLAIHIAAVVVAFGVTFAYPIFILAGAKLDPRGMPWFHRAQQLVGRRLIDPGLGLVLLAGIYLASKLHQWHAFYVQWGLAIAIVLGALEGAVMIRGEGRLAELAERDIAAAGGGEVQWSAEYEALARRTNAVGALMSLLVLITIYLMSVQAGT